jgi:hypothetical protein
MDVAEKSAAPDSGAETAAPIDAAPDVVARPDAAERCVTARDCDDRIDCTVDSCQQGRCVAEPDDARCVGNRTCDPEAGCESRAWALSRADVYDVRLPSGRATIVAKTTFEITDIGARADGALFGVDGVHTFVYSLVRRNGAWDRGADTGINGPSELTGLAIAPDSRMFAAGYGWIHRLAADGFALERIGTLPTWDMDYGDVAFVGTRGFVVAPDVSLENWLFEFSPERFGPATRIGVTGFPCVEGLAASGQELFGFTCQGEIIRIDIGSGKGTLVTTVSGATFRGAADRSKGDR